MASWFWADFVGKDDWMLVDEDSPAGPPQPFDIVRMACDRFGRGGGG